MALPHNTTGLSEFVIVIFPDHPHLLFFMVNTKSLIMVLRAQDYQKEQLLCNLKKKSRTLFSFSSQLKCWLSGLTFTTLVSESKQGLLLLKQSDLVSAQYVLGGFFDRQLVLDVV